MPVSAIGKPQAVVTEESLKLKLEETGEHTQNAQELGSVSTVQQSSGSKHKTQAMEWPFLPGLRYLLVII